jgi:formylglycine-generating enzyme required for sulfatase activity
MQQFVFISHSSKDKPRLRPLVDALITSGIKVWIDKPHELGYRHAEIKKHFEDEHSVRRLEAGVEWQRGINAALPNANIVLGVWSANVVKRFVTRKPGRRCVLCNEMTTARDIGTLVSCRIDDSKPETYPEDFDREEMPDIRNAGALALLVSDIRRRLRQAGASPADARRAADALRSYREARISHWSDPRYGAGDRLFTRLSLLLPQGPDTDDPWKKQDDRYGSLEEALDKHPEFFAIVLLGDPGAGKSTLLQRLDLDSAMRGMVDSLAPFCYFVSLRHYNGDKPMAWLREKWSAEQRKFPHLQDLQTLLARPGSILLLDAINEINEADDATSPSLLRSWSDFIADLKSGYPDCRVVFSCRSLDYSGLLATNEIPVPHLYIEKLDEPTILEFLEHYLRQIRPRKWKQLAADLLEKIRLSKQQNLYGTAYFLWMLIGVAARTGEVPEDSAALFTAFVRELVRRERGNHNALVTKPGPLDRGDLDRLPAQLRDNAWETPYELPEGGPLFKRLAELAYEMQAAGRTPEGCQLAISRTRAESLLKRDVFRAAIALNVLEEIVKVERDGKRKLVQFVHQLMQEYFAGRQLAKAPAPELARSPWREGEVPSIPATLPDAEPLPPLSTPWDETMLFGATMAEDRGSFLEGLIQQNLPLAGRAAAMNRPHLRPDLIDRIRQDLLSRIADKTAGLRARIDAGKALGELGDPRLGRKPGRLQREMAHDDGEDQRQDCIRPPTVVIPGGAYLIGNVRSALPWTEYNNSPRCEVHVGTFELGKFPVTNAEWRCFVEAGGYEDENWWVSDAAQRWRRGDSTYECWSHMWLVFREWLQSRDCIAERLWELREISFDEKENWIKARDQDDATFKAFLEEQRVVRSGRLTKPGSWALPAFNTAQQPVSGIGWFEAQAFCAWLSAQTGDKWRLPTEAEWEVAARLGASADVLYPWGNEFDSTRCNTSVSRIRATTPVGIFPDGDTDARLSDMSGNVLEWTASKYLNYPYRSDDGRDDDEHRSDPREYAGRVLRGGSWYYGRHYARISFRLRYHPGFRPRTAGFRLLREV